MSFRDLIEGEVAKLPSPREKLDSQIAEFMNRASDHSNHSQHHDQLGNKELSKAHKNVSDAYQGLVDTHYKQLNALSSSAEKDKKEKQKK